MHLRVLRFGFDTDEANPLETVHDTSLTLGNSSMYTTKITITYFISINQWGVTDRLYRLVVQIDSTDKRYSIDLLPRVNVVGLLRGRPGQWDAPAVSLRVR